MRLLSTFTNTFSLKSASFSLAVARSLYFLAELFLELAKYDEAKKYFDDALALQRMTFGQSHPHIGRSIFVY